VSRKKHRRKQKVRVPFQKNREKRARTGDLTRRLEEDQERIEDLETGERLTGKGELIKHRTVIAETDDESDHLLRAVDESRCLTGYVLAAIGANHCQVRSDAGETVTCTVRRVVRTLARDARNAVAAGDRVLFTPTGEDSGVIERVEPRASSLSRVSRGHEHVIVANVDQAVIVTSIDEPPLKLGLVDRFLCSTEKGNVRGIVCINKIDLLGQQARLQPIVGMYASLGYPVLLTNALTGDGIPQLRRMLRGHRTVFAGQSGVGKSSLLNAIQPGLGLRTAEVSPDSRKGRHTTRVAEVFGLPAATLASLEPASSHEAERRIAERGGSGLPAATLETLEPASSHEAERHIAERGGSGLQADEADSTEQAFDRDGGGWVVDTPGIRQFQLWDVIKEEVEGFFIEFRPFVARCRFPDCLHVHETGCAVKRGVALHMISPLRYESYLRIISDES
jgi:ribosome biogenesis GTPase / thiamine phosphate phosphatase